MCRSFDMHSYKLEEIRVLNTIFAEIFVISKIVYLVDLYFYIVVSNLSILRTADISFVKLFGKNVLSDHKS